MKQYRNNNLLWGFLALIFGVVIWWLLKKVKNPLVPPPLVIDDSSSSEKDVEYGVSSAAKVGMSAAESAAAQAVVSGVQSAAAHVAIKSKLVVPLDYNYQISKNFNLKEFLVSSSRPDLAKKLRPSDEQVNNIIALVTKLLQPVRDMWGKPLTINSGFRSKELNDSIGGSTTSDHMKGKAADVHSSNPQALYTLIQNSGLSYDQLILYPTFVHVGYRSPSENRKMFWVEQNKKDA